MDERPLQLQITVMKQSQRKTTKQKNNNVYTAQEKNEDDKQSETKT